MIEINIDDNLWLEIKFTRPQKANAITSTMFSDMYLALKKQNFIGVNFFAEGKHFSAGADLTEMQDPKTSLSMTKNIEVFFQELASLNCPIISHTKGHAAGAGVGIIASSDLVIAAQDSVFQCPEIVRGIAPAIIAPYVINKIGMHQAKLMFITGTAINAKKAISIGLVDVVGNTSSEYEAIKQNAGAIPKIKQMLKAKNFDAKQLQVFLANGINFR